MGIIEATSKSTNHTSHASGTVWSATILDGLMRNNWENSNGDVATDLFMGSYLRSITDTFTTKTNSILNSSDINTLDGSVSKFITSHGVLNIRTHRYIQQSTDATARVLAINPEKLKIAFLERPYIDTELSRNGDYDKRAVVGKFTLEVHNQDSNFYADGFKKA